MYHLFTAIWVLELHFVMQRTQQEVREGGTSIQPQMQQTPVKTVQIWASFCSTWVSLVHTTRELICSRNRHSHPSQDSSCFQAVIVSDIMSAPTMTGMFCCEHQSTTGQTLPTMLTLNSIPSSADRYLDVSGVIKKINHNLMWINADAASSQTPKMSLSEQHYLPCFEVSTCPGHSSLPEQERTQILP